MKIFLKHIAIFSVAAAVFAALYLSGIGCPFRAITGIPCPACGMTRSALALLRLDIRQSLEHNPATLLAVSALLIASHMKIFKRKKIADALTIILSSLVFIIYIIRLA